LYDLMFEQPTAHEDNWFEGAWKIYVPLPTDLVVAIYLCSSCSAPTTVSHTAGCSAPIASASLQRLLATSALAVVRHNCYTLVWVLIWN
jgi:predicted membrane-bound mannosyltransferase